MVSAHFNKRDNEGAVAGAGHYKNESRQDTREKKIGRGIKRK